MSRRQLILDTAADLAKNFIIYGRIEDEDLPGGEIEDALEAGEVTLDDILIAFRTQLTEELHL